MSHPHHHHETHFRESALLRDFVIGMSDGLTVPFALAAGLSGAVHSTSIIVTAGLAEIVAGSISMGLGGYLAGRTEIDHYEAELAREYDEVERIPEEERQEVRQVFARYGLSKSAQETIVSELSKDKHRWVDFMMRFELGLERPNIHQAPRSAARIALSYALGGIIPLSAYFWNSDPKRGLLFSSLITAVCLAVFGFLKSKLTGQKPWLGAAKVMLIGLCAAGAAYIIARQLGGSP